MTKTARWASPLHAVENKLATPIFMNALCLLFLVFSVVVLQVCGECATAKRDKYESKDHHEYGRCAEVFKGQGGQHCIGVFSKKVGEFGVVFAVDARHSTL